MHSGDASATSQIKQQQLEHERMQAQAQRQTPIMGDVSQLLSGSPTLHAADVMQSQQMQSQQVLAYYWQLYLTNALQQAGGQLPLPYMPGNMLGAAPFQSQFLVQQPHMQRLPDGLHQQPHMPLHMQHQYSMPPHVPQLDPQQQFMQLQQLQQFQQLSQQQSQQLQQRELYKQYQHLQAQPYGSNGRDTEDVVKRRSDDGVLAAAAKKPRKIRNENKVCSNCTSTNTPFWRKDRNTGLPLCNACGLYYAKNDAMRPKVLWKQDDGTSPSSALSKQSGQPPAVLQQLPSGLAAHAAAISIPNGTLQKHQQPGNHDASAPPASVSTAAPAQPTQPPSTEATPNQAAGNSSVSPSINHNPEGSSATPVHTANTASPT